MIGEALPLAAALRDARARTLCYVSDLDDARMRVPLLEHVNPLVWEIGHIAYFAEFWTLRHLHGRPPIVAHADSLYDSAKIPHDTRWSLPLPDRAQTLAFMQAQLEATLETYATDAGTPGEYFYQLALRHEDMHAEADVYTRQSVALPRPPLTYAPLSEAGALPGDAVVPAGTIALGTRRDFDGFVFDNEKWAHDVAVREFAIARAPVTNAEYAAFVDAGGYRDRRYWTPEGWAWRESTAAEHPVYWRQTTAAPASSNGTWVRRHFDTWAPLKPDQPVVHVNAHEASAYCAWAKRRLPTEAEWVAAARGAGAEGNLDARYGDVCDVAAFAQSESAHGCRQMLGNVWEWTASPFEPFPGFAPDPYKEYSAPWFGTHLVLRGGAWSTRNRLISTRFRNFYKPHRRDIITGFRTCAL